MRRITSLQLISLLITSICWSASVPDTRAIPDGMQSYNDFEKKITRYPYIASKERSDKIVAGLKKVEVCMNKKQIMQLLGPPDYSQINYGPKGPGEKWLGSSWMYFLSKESELVNRNDPSVSVSFDTKDRAQWIAPSNVEGAYEIGTPGKECL